MRSVEIYTAGDGTHSLIADQQRLTQGYTWTTIASGSGTISSIVVTGNNYPAWRAKVDNKILVNSGVSDNSSSSTFQQQQQRCYRYDAAGSND